MNRAVLYARVSGEMQKQEKTIESQIAEIKKHIADAGDVLVKEYIDEGITSMRFYRPALDELRNDLKANVFDAVYLYDVDRLARETTYQKVIIAEILKYRKRVVIKGKNYEDIPENKFILNMLGSMAEFERTKIIERTVRARQYKIAQGFLIGAGSRIYGYDYHRRTPTSNPSYTINEEEAKVVRYVFETYAKETIGMQQITRRLEAMNAPTKYRRNRWRISLLKCMLKNEMYLGTRYYNTMKLVREYANPIYDIKYSSRKIVRRPREEWIGIKVPAIVEKEIFEKVQKRIAWNKEHYRNPKKTQLLSNLMRCGQCNGSCFAYRRWYTDRRVKPPRIYHKVSYKCNWRARCIMHHDAERIACENPEIKAEIMEYHVFLAMQEFLFDPEKLKKCMDFFKGKTKVVNVRVSRRMKKINEKLKEIEMKKKRLVDLYASGTLDVKDYIEKNRAYDGETNAFITEHDGLAKQIPLLHKEDIVEINVKRFCETARTRFELANDFTTKRQFLLDYVEKIIYDTDHFVIHGSMPVKAGDADRSLEASKIQFKISGTIPMCERLGRSKEKRALWAKLGNAPVVMNEE